MKVPNIKSHESPSIGSRTETCGQTDMMKLRGVYRDYAKAPKIRIKILSLRLLGVHAPLFNITTYSGKQCTQKKLAKIQSLQDPNQAM